MRLADQCLLRLIRSSLTAGLLAAPARSTNVRTRTAQHLLSMADAPEDSDGSAEFMPADQVLRGQPGHMNARHGARSDRPWARRRHWLTGHGFDVDGPDGLPGGVPC